MPSSGRPSLMGRRPSRFVLLVVLFLPGADAAACHDLISFDLGADETIVRLDVLYTELDAARFRTHLDRDLGDGNGAVSDDEIDRYKADVADTRPSSPQDDCLADEVVRRDNRQPDAIETRSAEVDLGPRNAGSTDPLRIAMRTVLSWEGAPVSRATYRLDIEDHENVETMSACLGAASLDPYPATACPGVVWVVRAHAGRLDVVSVAAQGLGDLMDDDVLRIAGANARARFLDSDQTFLWEGRQSDPLVPLVIGAGLVGLAVVVWAWTREVVRYRVHEAALSVVAGFTRLKRDDALGHPRREAIVEAVRAEPGIHLTELRRRLGCGTGSIVHHVRVLERHRLVRKVREGAVVRFLPVEADDLPGPYLTMVQRRLLDAVRAHPGATQKELADRLIIPRGTVGYNARRLEELGLVVVERDGTLARHFPPR